MFQGTFVAQKRGSGTESSQCPGALFALLPQLLHLGHESFQLAVDLAEGLFGGGVAAGGHGASLTQGLALGLQALDLVHEALGALVGRSGRRGLFGGQEAGSGEWLWRFW